MKQSKKVSVILGIAALAVAPNVAAATTVRTIYSFCNASCTDGAYPQTLVSDSLGHIYGMAAFGGSASGYNGRGTAFELIPASHGKWSLGRVHVFCQDESCSDGSLPQAGLVVDNSGNLYGTTAEGGAGHGNVFKLVSQDAGTAWSFQNLYSFSGPDGDNPSSPLTYAGETATSYYDGTSPLYGSTVNGGKVDSGGGTVFQLTPQGGGGWTLATLHDFSGDGWDCDSGSLFISTAGPVYGETYHCGSENEGYVYALSQADGQWTESNLYSFYDIGGDDTYGPSGPLGITTTGSLFGVTAAGGPHCRYHHHHGYFRCGGGVFELNPNGDTWNYASIYTFCRDGKFCLDGQSPLGGLVRTASGAFYGTTVAGGANDKGVIFKIAKSGKYSILYSFCSKADCADGANPSGPLLPGPHGRLYGATSAGGTNNWGTVFELTP